MAVEPSSALSAIGTLRSDASRSLPATQIRQNNAPHYIRLHSLAGCGHQRIDHSILELDGEDYRAEPLAEREEEAVSNSCSEHRAEYVEHLARLY